MVKTVERQSSWRDGAAEERRKQFEWQGVGVRCAERYIRL